METLIKFKNFVDEINKENGRNYKLSILEKYKDDEDIKYYLEFIFNPYKVTGISDKKLNKNIIDFAQPARDDVYWLLENILTNNTGSDMVIRWIKSFEYYVINPYCAEHQLNDSDHYDLLESIIKKDVTLNIAVLSINKIIPNLIPTFNVQLANKYFDNPTVVEGKEFALTTKIDGGRIIALKKNGIARFFTRQGQEYEGLTDLKEEMEKNMPDNLCLDGEITLLDPWVVDSITDDVDLWGEDHKIGRKLDSGEQYKETMKITRKDGEKHGVKMLVFDAMTTDQFEAQNCPSTYAERRVVLNNIFSKKFTYFNLLPILYQGNDTNEITKWLNYNISQGEEGVMINMINDSYKFKRTDSLLKVKKMHDLDLEVIGYEEGSGANLGMLGAFLVRYKDGNTVKVGSGFTKELRQEIWKDPESYIGKIISVQYFEETNNANGGLSLRFPVFLDFRPDKLTPDF